MKRNCLNVKGNFFSISIEEMRSLYEFLNIIQQKQLHYLLMHDIFLITPPELPLPLKNIFIRFVFNLTNPDQYYMKATLTPAFIIKKGYLPLINVSEHCEKTSCAFNTTVLYSDNRGKIYEDGRISLYCGAGVDDFLAPALTPLMLDNSQSFEASFKSFMELIELTLAQIIPDEAVTITLNEALLNEFLKYRKSKGNTYVVDCAPQALLKVLEKSNQNCQPPPLKNFNFKEKTSLPKLKRAAEFSVGQPHKVPLALKRVQNKNE